MLAAESSCPFGVREVIELPGRLAKTGRSSISVGFLRWLISWTPCLPSWRFRVAAEPFKIGALRTIYLLF
jgi:hypothetical protein